MISPQVQALPQGLAQFAEKQPFYTYGQEAAWRYIRRVNHTWLEQNAHTAYPESVRLLLIPIDNVPRIERVNKILSKVGFGAIGVNGFIHPLAFMGLQYHGVMPVSTDMRLPEHIAYTPSPDIVHESLGHLAMLSDEKYRQCLRLLGEVGVSAHMSDADLEHYNAVRKLSILKEDPRPTPEQIEQAQEELKIAEEVSNKNPSELKKAARLYWWTIEYGLVKSHSGPRIYGAGLISSLSEGRNSLKDPSKIIPLTLNAVINQPYDITKEQGIYFLADDFDHIIKVVEEFKSTLSSPFKGDYNKIEKSAQRTHVVPVDEKLDKIYYQIRCARNDHKTNYNLAHIWQDLIVSFPNEWLPNLELLEALKLRDEEKQVQLEIVKDLKTKAQNPKLTTLINDGLSLLGA